MFFLRKKYKQKETRFLYLVSFIAGGVVMTIEVTASRLLAPYFGSSLFIWTSTITVVLAALSIGYFIASRLSVRKNIHQILVIALLGASLVTFLIPYIVYFTGSFLPVYIEGGIPTAGLFSVTFFVSLLALMPAGIFYGLFSPIIIEILGRNGHHPGKTAGTIFAVSTLGSIAGTILGAILFIPVVGTHLTFIIAAAIMAMLVLFIDRSKWIYAIFFIISILLLGFLTKPNPLKNEKVLVYKQSAYQDIRLVDDGDYYSFIYNEGLGVQSVYTKDSPYTNNYWDWLTVIPYIREKQEQDILIIGFAGGTSSRLFSETPVASQIKKVDAVEIDKEVVKISREFFSKNDYGSNIYIDDGRHFLQSTQNQYDIIIVDAFQGLSMPFQFSTVEFNQLIETHLNQEGIMAMNIALGLEGSLLVEGLLNTSVQVFDYVYALSSPDKFNIILLGSNIPISEDKLDEWQAKAGISTINLNLTKQEYYDGLVFTDDKSPVEFLSDLTVFSFL